MDEERLIAIETKLAHQEDLVEQLNRIVTEQASRIAWLEDLCRTLGERLRAVEAASGAGEAGGAEERPPHY